MPRRKILPLCQKFGATLGLLALTFANGARADSDDRFPLLTMLQMVPPSSNVASATPNSRPLEELVVHEVTPQPQLRRSIDLTAPTNDLWDRIRNGYAMPNLNDDLVLYYQQWYQNRPDTLRRMVERSRPYMHYIVEELQARGMPTELALLPMVESSFNPMAYSRAHAAGLWQFIPATGKRFNLEQNWWQDQRRDVVASTNAALDYLQTIYEMHGDWHLALASYNWGENAVRRAIEKNDLRGLPTDYASLNMPAETRHYVPKLQALKNIFGNPELVARLDLPPIPNRPYLAMLETPRPIDVKTAARLAGLTVEEFQRLNPAHNRPIIKPESAVVIPADRLESFHANLHNNPAPLSEWQAFTLKNSDRLSNVAQQFGISLGELARANSLPEKARLGAGSTLLVPGNSGNLGPLLSSSGPLQLLEAEPVARSCGKRATRCSKTVAQHDSAHGKATPSEAKNGKQLAKSSSKPEKTAEKTGHLASNQGITKKGASSKPSSPAVASAPRTGGTKVARSGNQRRG